ncbi:response regulator [Pararhodospirillum oryzae]|uniref:Response regulator n=1 Tax=Pararhodospirillum oryzae TaxID=478448 RepID=A0A512H391_9PROT|nr:response regulator [Pararhodospirillum oryzae]GEO79901.1 response regulator [Pararhodospirillum oryzae]
MAVKVMIVDDSFMMRMLIADVVKADPDLSVVGDADNGKTAMDRVAGFAPDVVLLDIEMPVMDGLETLKRLKLASRAKVIIVSSVAQVGSPQAMEARRLGAFDVIAKPSGAMSLDLKEKRGSEIVRAVRKAAGLPA